MTILSDEDASGTTSSTEIQTSNSRRLSAVELDFLEYIFVRIGGAVARLYTPGIEAGAHML